MRDLTITAYNSFAEEAKSESKRRSMQTPQERLKEFSILQDRCFGKDWGKKKMIKKVTWETVQW
jgi:hypothetical protein